MNAAGSGYLLYAINCQLSVDLGDCHTSLRTGTRFVKDNFIPVSFNGIFQRINQSTRQKATG